MVDEKPKPKWVRILHVYRWALFTPARSFGARFCKVFVAFKAVMVVLELLLPGEGVAYLSWGHWGDVGGQFAAGVAWLVALLFVRERDQARAELKAAQFEYAVTPTFGGGRIWEWRYRGSHDDQSE